MFPLHTATLPSSAADLERALNESLQRIFVTLPSPVAIRDHAYPHLSEVNISLDGARLDPESPRPQATSGPVSPALEIDRFTVHGSPLSVGPLALDLSISATGVQLGQSKDSNEQIVLFLKDATEGTITISVRNNDLEALVTELARSQASKHGITIEGVELTLHQENERSLAAEVRLRARKLFLAASVKVTGRITLDEELKLKILDLNCSGEGGIGNVACGILQPYLQKADGREFPLMSLPLGEIQLRDVRLVVSDKLSVTAEFGGAT